MSSINCSNCGSPNPAGSRFCNNCGNLLRAATKLICPNCKTPNPNHLMYCDHCGTRLVRDGTAKKPEKPAGSSPSASNVKPFSLPARPSGKTADLDLDGEIPDWLKTGGAKNEAPAGDSASNTPDWLTENQPPAPPPSKDTTDDLPDWLNNLALPGTGPLPFRKTTDELISNQKKQAESDLPDWLTEWQIEEPTTTIESETESNAPDWLNEYHPETPLPAATKPPTTSARELLNNPDPIEEDNIPDWLREAEPTPLPTPSPVQQINDDGMPDWLRSFDLPIDTPPSSQVEAKSSPAGEGIPDWLVEDPLATSPTANVQPPTPPAGQESLRPPTTSKGQGYSAPPINDDWLPELFATPDNQQSTLAQSDDDNMPDWLSTQDVSHWDTPVAQQTSVSNDLSDWLTELESLSPPHEEPQTTASQSLSPTEQMPDWLSAMAPPTTGPLRLPEGNEGPELEVFYTDFEDLPDWLKGPETATTSKELPKKSEKEPAKQSEPVEELDEFWATLGNDSQATDDQFPDWLSAMESGQFEPQNEVTNEPNVRQAVPISDLPDWLTEVTGQENFDFADEPPLETSALAQDVLPTLPGSAELQGIPKQLASTSLPDWMDDNPFTTPLEKQPEPLEVPDWLRPAKPGAFDTLITPEEPVVLPTSGEWSNILGDLPPTDLPPVSINKGDIPEWLEALKPSEEIVGATLSAEEPEQTTGPLAGMRGVIEIEPIIAKPSVARMSPRPGITPEQEKQVALLRQLTRGETSQPTAVTQQTHPGFSATLRLALSVVLVVVVLAGLWFPDLFPTPLPAGENINQIQQTLLAAAGQPVLVAFDYPPALSGELGPQADLLLSQLAANNSPVILVSQTATGLALGEQATGRINQVTNYNLGLLPGQAIGLRKLANCLSNNEQCQTVYGNALDEQTQQSLTGVRLIILLTSERDVLVNWVEQVHTPTNLPIIVGLTQSMMPVAQPYLVSGQLSGLLNGLPDAARLEQAIGSDQHLLNQYHALSWAQLLVAGLLIVGNLIYLIRGLLRSRRGFAG